MKTILVVDDEPSIAQMIRQILQEEGYKVVIAANGQEGLDQLTAMRPHLVLCDIMMPVLSGTEMFRIMHADPALRDVPVVLMSAAAEPVSSDPRNYIGFLRKPFDYHSLMHVVTLGLGPADQL